MRRICWTAAVAALVALVATTLTAVVAGPPAAAEGRTARVTVQDFRFDPTPVYIAPGDSVEWAWGSGGHTVTAADGSFAGEINASSPTYTHTFESEGTYSYRCVIHSSMKGVVVVEPAETFQGDVLHVPSDAPTLRRAVDIARAGTTIVLEEASVTIYEPVVVDTPGLTITSGTKAKRVLPVTLTPGPGPVDYAIDVQASDVTVRGLTIENFARAGVRVGAGHRNARLENLHLRGNRDSGVVSFGNLSVANVTATGSRRAGVTMRDCDDCGRVDGLVASRNFVGVEIVNGAGAVVLRSTITDNANGIVVASNGVGTASAAGVDIVGNVVSRNTVTDGPRPSVFEDDPYAGAGTGIWVAGAEWVRALDNTVSDHRWGIVATALGSATASDDSVIDNAVSASERADLSWDGLGTGTCFGGNTATTSTPSDIEARYPCGGPVPTVGVPLPVAQSDLALHALQTFYCRDAGAC